MYSIKDKMRPEGLWNREILDRYREHTEKIAATPIGLRLNMKICSRCNTKKLIEGGKMFHKKFVCRACLHKDL